MESDLSSFRRRDLSAPREARDGYANPRDALTDGRISMAVEPRLFPSAQPAPRARDADTPRGACHRPFEPPRQEKQTLSLSPRDLSDVADPRDLYQPIPLGDQLSG